MIDEDDFWSNWWNEDWQGKPKYSEKNLPQYHFVHHKIRHDQTRAWTPDRNGGKPATNRLSYCTNSGVTDRRLKELKATSVKLTVAPRLQHICSCGTDAPTWPTEIWCWWQTLWSFSGFSGNETLLGKSWDKWLNVETRQNCRLQSDVSSFLYCR
jgi:hypothetical protein